MNYTVRLDSILVKNNVTSERRVRRFLQTHDVMVNDKRVFMGGSLFDLWNDTVSIDGRILEITRDVYLMMNKCAGTVCSSLDGDDRSVLDGIDKDLLYPSNLPPLHMVGRLDKDTEGLLILTTDGELSHKLTNPESHISKTYYVRLKNPVCHEEKLAYIQKCRSGFFIPREKMESSFTCKSSSLEFIDDISCYLTITEGKFHQVKRMFMALGNEVTYLKREKMSLLKLDPMLKSGEYRHLTSDELCLLTYRSVEL